LSKREIVVVFRSQEVVTGSADWRGIHLCDYGHVMSGGGVVPLSDMQGKADRFVPQDQYPLVYAASLAARRLGCEIVYVDLATLPLIQRVREQLRGLPVPRVVVGDRYLTGTPSSDEIVQLFNEVCGVQPIDSRDGPREQEHVGSLGSIRHEHETQELE